MARPRVYQLAPKGHGEFNGLKLYYVGFSAQPRLLGKNGRGFTGLKHVLELLKGRFKKFTLTISPTKNGVVRAGGTWKVTLSVPRITWLRTNQIPAVRPIKVRLAKEMLGLALPNYFDAQPHHVYERGMFEALLAGTFDPRQLTAGDRAALTKFVQKTLPKTVGLDVASIVDAKQDLQLVYLAQLIKEFSEALDAGHLEGWWQSYFDKNILYFQENYIQKVEKANVSLGGTKYPDFMVLTSDDYVDIIEIKMPDTEILKYDAGRDNYFWSAEAAKAIVQVENYIDRVSKQGAQLSQDIETRFGIKMRVVKPRGIIIAGKRAQFGGKQKMADDFRLLNEGLKNVAIVPYDDLSQRLQNTMTSIQKLASSAQPKRAKSRKRPKKTSRKSARGTASKA